MSAGAAVEAGHGPTGAAALVAFNSVTKRFPGVLANDAVSFSVRGGEVHVLLGENGAGKSTLIGMLAGMQQPDDGTIWVQGRPIRVDTPARALSLGIGTVFQHNMLVPSLSVAENLMLGGSWWRRPRRGSLRGRFAATCAAFGIEIDADAITGSLSLGEQQQVEIIRALWRGGKVIVLDEPTAMLSPAGIAELGALIRRMAAQGIGVVFITHKLHEALDYGDRITVLRLGRIAGEIDPVALRALSRQQATERIIELMFGTTAPREGLEPGQDGQAVAADAPLVLEACGLGLRDSGRQALHGVSFAVRAGEIFGIAGIDGNGQRELAECLGGQNIGTGEVRLDGRPLGRLGVIARRGLGLRYVTDDRLGEGTVGSFPLSVNLLLKQIGEPPFWRAGVARAALIERHATRLVLEHDIRTPSARTPIGKLSGGNIQKALLARELADGARAVIYNKPTHGLEVRNIALARARIARGATEGLATVLISTDLDEVLVLSHRIGVMVRGEMVGIVTNGPEARAEIGRLMTGVAIEPAHAV